MNHNATLKNPQIGFLLGLVLLYLLAFGARYGILRANVAVHDGYLPFTLESALQFRMTEKVYTGEGIPDHEPMIEYPDGIDVVRTDTVGAEYVYAALAKLLPDRIPLSDRVRWITIAWFSLSVPLLAWWVAGWARSRFAGLISGFFYAVMLASVIRSSGLEISRENFAIPFLILHLSLDVAARNAFGRSFWLRAIGSSLSLALALAFWDMIQFYVLLWTATFVIRSLFALPSHRPLLVLQAFGLILAGALTPYHRAHGLLFGPAMMLVYGGLLAIGIEQLWQHRRSPSPVWRVVLILLPVSLWFLLSPPFAESYGHFTELMAAKIQFLNVKPADPTLLTFQQRILWVPALDSATWSLTVMLFPASLYLVFVSMVFAVLSVWVRRTDRSGTRDALLLQYIFFFVFSFIAYVLFVRFHVYVAIWAAAWIGRGWAEARGRIAKGVLGVTLLAGVLVESGQTLVQQERWGRSNVYVRELIQLTDWLRDQVSAEPVLANFGVSGSILTYGGSAIVLHPKFERQQIRDRVEAYGTELFKGTEESFRDWADAHGAAYYVYAMGEFAERSPELQMRYFVDALEPPPEAPARIFEFAPESARYFELLWGNRKYRVFRVISKADQDTADTLAGLAASALARGDWHQAAERAWGALALFPHQSLAQEVVHRAALMEEAAVGR